MCIPPITDDSSKHFLRMKYLNKKINLKLLEGEEHTQENFKGTINMFVDDEEPQFLVQNQIIKFYFWV